MKKKHLKVIAWLPALAVMAIIFYFSSRTGEASGAQSDPIAQELARRLGLGASYIHAMVVLVRKSGHFLEFGALSFCFALAFIVQKPLNASLGWSLAFSYLYALSDELHQIFVPGRSGRFGDTLIDLAGSLAGLVFFRLLFWLIKSIKKQPK